MELKEREREAEKERERGGGVQEREMKSAREKETKIDREKEGMREGGREDERESYDDMNTLAYGEREKGRKPLSVPEMRKYTLSCFLSFSLSLSCFLSHSFSLILSLSHSYSEQKETPKHWRDKHDGWELANMDSWEGGREREEEKEGGEREIERRREERESEWKGAFPPSLNIDIKFITPFVGLYFSLSFSFYWFQIHYTVLSCYRIWYYFEPHIAIEYDTYGVTVLISIWIHSFCGCSLSSFLSFCLFHSPSFNFVFLLSHTLLCLAFVLPFSIPHFLLSRVRSVGLPTVVCRFLSICFLCQILFSVTLFLCFSLSLYLSLYLYLSLSLSLFISLYLSLSLLLLIETLKIKKWGSITWEPT